MADIDKRLRYFNGQFLEQQDFRDEQDYHVDRERRHNRLFHTFGIAEGLTVDAPANAGEIEVATGTALDGQGRQIVLTGERTLPLGSSAGKAVLVVISYDEQGVLPAQVGKQGEMTRWEEHPKVELVEEDDAEAEDVQIRLGKVVVSQGGTVVSFDTSVRRAASVRLNPGAVAGAALAAGSVTTDKIADLGVSTGKIANNAVTTAKLADLSVTGAQLANNAVTGAKITDATINEVKFDAATRAKLGSGGLGNGGTINGSLAILGGLDVGGSIGGFGLDQIHAATLPFTNANADGFQTSVSINFIPRLILLTGGISGRFDTTGDTRFGGTICGFAFQTITTSGGDGGPDTSSTASVREAAAATPEAITLPGPIVTITQLCHGPSIVRAPGASGPVRQDAVGFSAIAGASFLARHTSPVQGQLIQLTVTSMTLGNVTFRLSRSLVTPATSLLDVESFSFNVIILGHLDTSTF